MVQVLKAGGHRIRAEDCLPVGRSTGENLPATTATPTPPLLNSLPLTVKRERSIFLEQLVQERTELSCCSETGALKWMVYILNDELHLTPAPFLYLDPRRQLSGLYPPVKESGGGFLCGEPPVQKKAYKFWHWGFLLKKSALSSATEAHWTTRTNTYSFPKPYS